MNLKLREHGNHQGLGVFTSREIFGTVDIKHYVMAEECKFENIKGWVHLRIGKSLERLS